MDRITFQINGVEHSVGSEVTSDVTLLDYIRNYAELRGTKYMCREAGCGACIVSAVKSDDSGPIAVNSCMVSVTSCKDWEITTVEKVGNKLEGYNTLQTTLAKCNGTQCGHCTPGWIMSMYSLVQSKQQLTMLEIEKSLASNICRCTGYRPILEAFKKFAVDAPKSSDMPDIEDLHICNRNGKRCFKKQQCQNEEWCLVSKDDVKQSKIIEINLKDDRKWFRVESVADIFSVLDKEGKDFYMLVGGNTAKGVNPIYAYPRILIDISSVNELKGYELDQNLIIGSGTTLTEALDVFKREAEEEYFGYLQQFYDHLSLVAHVAVRNIGTIAGNLMIKYYYNDFPSDIFLLLETVGAELTIKSSATDAQVVTMQEFLKLDMTGKIIFNVLLPPLNSKYKLVTYKIMPRAQNAHAIVNAGFLYKIEGADNVVEDSRIVFGNISPTFIRATATEKLLLGKKLFTNETLQAAVQSLNEELAPEENPPDPSPALRKQLAINLFYKGLLTLCPEENVDPRYRSGVTNFQDTRPVSVAQQNYDTDPSLWPLNEPVQKIEALIQCSGEAKYTEDIPALPQEVFAAFVLSNVPKGTIVSIDPSTALKIPGVIQFYSAKDIPGLNSFIPVDHLIYQSNEELLCDGEVKYFNQPIGIIVAEKYHIADKAAKRVDVTYRNIEKPVIDIKEAKTELNRNIIFLTLPAFGLPGLNVRKIIKTSTTIYAQYHFPMETLVCVSEPVEDGLKVHVSSQWADSVKMATSQALNMDNNSIDVYIRRVGGGFGMKISRVLQPAVACSLVAKKLNRPCRFIQSLTTNMRAVGKRLPSACDFEAAVNKHGEIQYLTGTLYEDNGYKIDELISALFIDSYHNCYDQSRWNYTVFNTFTDTAKNTWCRSPGSLECIAMAEMLMEQIAYELDVDPLEVRLANLPTKAQDLRDMIDKLKTDAQYAERRAAVDKFNKDNRWKKRGLRFSLLRWTPLNIQYLSALISVFHGDGSVVITHGGVEMGQGINTKAAQICAYLLEIPLDKIQVKGQDTISVPNSSLSGGSTTSQNIGMAITRACKELLQRLEPIRAQMSDPTWEELVKKAYNSNVDLQVQGFMTVVDNIVQLYDIYGVTLAEVEVDILTGEFQILRVDLAEDVGQSVSPEIDIGQVEGAFIMGLGYWTCENLVYNQDTGELLTDRTWTYHVPQARDIPQDFRIYFRKMSYSNDLLFGSKATGEPPICMSVVIPFAIREALAAARLESGIPTTDWFQIDGPYTLEKICLAAYTKIEDFKYK